MNANNHKSIYNSNLNRSSAIESSIKSPIKVGVIGITGKVGSLLANMIRNNPCFELSGGTHSKSQQSDFRDLAHASDVFIDFSIPESTLKSLAAAKEAKIPFVSGTTGMSSENFEEIKRSSEIIPVLHTPNFSIAIHLMASLLKKCSQVLDGYDIFIMDKHHKNKKDAPSGTSLFLAEKLGKEAQMLSVRGGNIPAEMICDMIGQHDMLSISHRAFGREVFAEGSLNCAKWIRTKTESRMYSMEEYIENRIQSCCCS